MARSANACPDCHGEMDDAHPSKAAHEASIHYSNPASRFHFMHGYDAALRQEPAESDAHQMAARLRGSDWRDVDETPILDEAADFILAQSRRIAELEQEQT